MRNLYVALVVISIFAVFLGLCIISVFYNATNVIKVSDTWVVELEPHLNLSDKELMRQIQYEEIGELQILKVRHMSEYLDMHASISYVNVVGDIPPSENRYVLYIHEDSINSSEETEKLLTDIDGIVNANEISYKVYGASPKP